MTDTRDDIVISFKPHGGYDSPLVAIKGATPAEVADKVAALGAVGLWALIGNADNELKAQWALAKGLDAMPVQHPTTAQQNYRQNAPQGGNGGGQRPQAATVPPGLTAPTCPHGTKTYVEGRYGPFWGCPAARDDQTKCKPEKINAK